MNKQEEIYNKLEEYRNYLHALEYYKMFGNQYGDKDYIDMYEEKQKEKKKEINNDSKRNERR